MVGLLLSLHFPVKRQRGKMFALQLLVVVLSYLLFDVSSGMPFFDDDIVLFGNRNDIGKLEASLSLTYNIVAII